MRLTREQIQELKDRYDKKHIYSYSALNTFTTSPYEYFLQKIKKEDADAEPSIYATLGGAAHDILEKLYTNQIKYEDMTDMWKDEWTASRTIAQMKFNRSDSEMDDRIGNKYYKDLLHFFDTHVQFKQKLECERHLHCLVGDHLMNGYADAIYRDGDDVVILDFKSSSMFKEADIKQKSYQLTLYALCLMSMGIPRDHIKIGFDMLKYTTVTTQLANGNKKKRDIERATIGKSLKSNIAMWLQKEGYSKKEINDYISDVLMYNTTTLLPDEVKARFEFEDCLVMVELTDDLIDDCKNYIISTIDEINRRFKEYKETGDEAIWYDTDDSVDKQSYYFANLCQYTANKHIPYKMYIERYYEENPDKRPKEYKKNEPKEEKQDWSEITKDIGESDLSWLNNL